MAVGSLVLLWIVHALGLDSPLLRAVDAFGNQLVEPILSNENEVVKFEAMAVDCREQWCEWAFEFGPATEMMTSYGRTAAVDFIYLVGGTYRPAVSFSLLGESSPQSNVLVVKVAPVPTGILSMAPLVTTVGAPVLLNGTFLSGGDPPFRFRFRRHTLELLLPEIVTDAVEVSAVWTPTMADIEGNRSTTVEVQLIIIGAADAPSLPIASGPILVHVPPSGEVHLSAHETTVGGHVGLRAEVQHGTPPLSYMWSMGPHGSAAVVASGAIAEVAIMTCWCHGALFADVPVVLAGQDAVGVPFEVTRLLRVNVVPTISVQGSARDVTSGGVLHVTVLLSGGTLPFHVSLVVGSDSVVERVTTNRTVMLVFEPSVAHVGEIRLMSTVVDGAGIAASNDTLVVVHSPVTANLTHMPRATVGYAVTIGVEWRGGLPPYDVEVVVGSNTTLFSGVLADEAYLTLNHTFSAVSSLVTVTARIAEGTGGVLNIASNISVHPRPSISGAVGRPSAVAGARGAPLLLGAVVLGGVRPLVVEWSLGPLGGGLPVLAGEFPVTTEVNASVVEGSTSVTLPEHLAGVFAVAVSCRDAAGATCVLSSASTVVVFRAIELVLSLPAEAAASSGVVASVTVTGGLPGSLHAMWRIVLAAAPEQQWNASYAHNGTTEAAETVHVHAAACSEASCDARFVLRVCDEIGACSPDVEESMLILPALQLNALAYPPAWTAGRALNISATVLGGEQTRLEATWSFTASPTVLVEAVEKVGPHEAALLLRAVFPPALPHLARVHGYVLVEDAAGASVRANVSVVLAVPPSVSTNTSAIHAVAGERTMIGATVAQGTPPFLASATLTIDSGGDVIVCTSTSTVFNGVAVLLAVLLEGIPPSPFPLPATFRVHVVDVSGAATNATGEGWVFPAMSISAMVPPRTTVGALLRINVTVRGGLPGGGRLEWTVDRTSDSAVVIASELTSTFAAAETLSFTFLRAHVTEADHITDFRIRFVARDEGGHTASHSVDVAVSSPPSVHGLSVLHLQSRLPISATTVGIPVLLRLDTSGGRAPLSFVWTVVDAVTNTTLWTRTGSNVSLVSSWATSSLLRFHVVVSDASGVTSPVFNDTTLMINPPIQVSVDLQPVRAIAGTHVTARVMGVTGGTPDFTFSWRGWPLSNPSAGDTTDVEGRWPTSPPPLSLVVRHEGDNSVVLLVTDSVGAMAESAPVIVRGLSAITIVTAAVDRVHVSVDVPLELYSTVTGGDGVYSLLWRLVSGAKTLTVTAPGVPSNHTVTTMFGADDLLLSSATTFSVVLFVSSLNSTAQSAPLEVTVHPLPRCTIMTSATVTTAGALLELVVSVTRGSGAPYLYELVLANEGGAIRTIASLSSSDSSIVVPFIVDMETSVPQEVHFLLTLTDQYGGRATASSHMVVVFPAPAATGFRGAPSSVGPNLPVTLSVEGVVGGLPPFTSSFEVLPSPLFVDANVARVEHNASGVVVAYSFPASAVADHPVVYVVTVSIVDANGGRSVHSTSITLLPPPAGTLRVSDAVSTAGATVTFVLANISGDGERFEVAWAVMRGETVLLAPPVDVLVGMDRTSELMWPSPADIGEGWVTVVVTLTDRRTSTRLEERLWMNGRLRTSVSLLAGVTSAEHHASHVTASVDGGTPPWSWAISWPAQVPSASAHELLLPPTIEVVVSPAFSFAGDQLAVPAGSSTPLATSFNISARVVDAAGQESVAFCSELLLVNPPLKATVAVDEEETTAGAQLDSTLTLSGGTGARAVAVSLLGAGGRLLDEVQYNMSAEDIRMVPMMVPLAGWEGADATVSVRVRVHDQIGASVGVDSDIIAVMPPLSGTVSVSQSIVLLGDNVTMWVDIHGGATPYLCLFRVLNSIGSVEESFSTSTRGSRAANSLVFTEPMMDGAQDSEFDVIVTVTEAHGTLITLVLSSQLHVSSSPAGAALVAPDEQTSDDGVPYWREVVFALLFLVMLCCFVAIISRYTTKRASASEGKDAAAAQLGAHAEEAPPAAADGGARGQKVGEVGPGTAIVVDNNVFESPLYNDDQWVEFDGAKSPRGRNVGSASSMSSDSFPSIAASSSGPFTDLIRALREANSAAEFHTHRYLHETARPSAHAEHLEDVERRGGLGATEEAATWQSSVAFNSVRETLEDFTVEILDSEPTLARSLSSRKAPLMRPYGSQPGQRGGMYSTASTASLRGLARHQSSRSRSRRGLAHASARGPGKNASNHDNNTSTAPRGRESTRAMAALPVTQAAGDGRDEERTRAGERAGVHSSEEEDSFFEGISTTGDGDTDGGSHLTPATKLY